MQTKFKNFNSEDFSIEIKKTNRYTNNRILINNQNGIF